MDVKKFKEVIWELMTFFDELTALEDEKLRAIAENNLKKLEECMSREQVAIMQLKVLEKHRAQIQAQGGYEGLSFRELLTKLPEEDRTELGMLYNQLADKLIHFNTIADSVRTSIEANLYSIDAILERLKQKNGQPSVNDKGFSSKRV